MDEKNSSTKGKDNAPKEEEVKKSVEGVTEVKAEAAKLSVGPPVYKRNFGSK